MYATNRNFHFFQTRMKKNNTKVGNHSRSISSKNQNNRNSASVKKKIIPKPVLSKKQLQIRQAIQYRFKKSKMKDYIFEYTGSAWKHSVKRNLSSQIQEYKDLKNLRIVNLKDFHQQAQKAEKKKSQSKNSILKRFKMRTDSSLIIKTQGSQKSFEKVKNFKPYLNSQTPRNKDDWKFISIQIKDDKNRSKSKKNEMKAKSYRTLNVQQKSKTKMKSVERHWEISTKLKQLSKIKKYKW